MAGNAFKCAAHKMALVAIVYVSFFSIASAAMEWRKISEGNLGPGFSPGLIWSPEVKRYIYFCGEVSHQFKGTRPYDVMSYDPATGVWRNELPEGAEKRGPEIGDVEEIPFKTPWYGFGDRDGLQIPNRRHTQLWYQYTYAPWDGKVYMLICGRMLAYDPVKRLWQENRTETGPSPEANAAKSFLSWGALCADPINREILLFGGGGVITTNSSPGTWVYTTANNTWRKLELAVEPPPRALAPMVYDPSTRKIVLFGGDRLDQLYADTWVYDCATHNWEERHPELSPSPRFGHALLRIPESGKLVLVGGKGYTSSISYFANLYKPLPFEIWSYDVAANKWILMQYFAEWAPADYSGANQAATAAAGPLDQIIWIGPGTEKGSLHSSWECKIDVNAKDLAGTAERGVKPDSVTWRTGSYDPDWYNEDVSEPDPVATATFLEKLTPNVWTPIEAPKWPVNRQGGGWSTVTLDTDRDQILHMGGGHSSYFGNDVAHYDIKNGRWSIACRPQFALEYNYDLTGPGIWAFNGAPWGNHNYRAYVYDPTIKRLVYIKTQTLFYDPVSRTWPYEEKFQDIPFTVSKYVNYLCPTPKGVVCWTPYKGASTKYGLWLLKDGKSWEELPTSGVKMPVALCDGSTITYDSKRNRLLLTTTYEKEEWHGQVWSVDFGSGEVSELNPAGKEKIVCKRFAREAVYLPASDMVLLGYILRDGDEDEVVPIYDCANNRWLKAEIEGSRFINARKAAPGSSVDLGLVYDAKRDLIWGTLCNLKPGSLQVLKLDAKSLKIKPM